MFIYFCPKIQLSLCDALNLNDGAVTRGKSLEARARRHGLGQELNVHLVHGGKVLHISQVDIVLDNLLERRARELEHLLEVLKNGPLHKLELVGCRQYDLKVHNVLWPA